jgi:hypothetical protein
LTLAAAGARVIRGPSQGYELPRRERFGTRLGGMADRLKCLRRLLA